MGKRFLLLGGSLRRGLLFCSPLLSFGLELEHLQRDLRKLKTEMCSLHLWISPREQVRLQHSLAPGMVQEQWHRNDSMEYLDRTTQIPRAQSGTDAALSLAYSRTVLSQSVEPDLQRLWGWRKEATAAISVKLDWYEVILEDANMDR